MADTVKLRHSTWTDFTVMPNRLEPFYDGEVVAHDGTVEIETWRRPWLHAAMMRGYNVTPDGRRLDNHYDLDAEIARQAGERETHEGSNSRRQSPS